MSSAQTLMLSSSRSQLAEVLAIHDVSDEEELGHSILALLTTVHESSPKFSLAYIAQEIYKAHAASLLEPLDTLPILLPCKDPAAREILSLIGECGSAKETVIAIQEAAERLIPAFNADDEDEDEDDKDDKDDATMLSIPGQLERLIDLFSACIPRLKLRRKTPSQTLSPILSELEDLVQLAGSRVSREEGLALLSSVSSLVVRLGIWSRSIEGGETGDHGECDKYLEKLLNCTLLAFEQCVQSSLTQRTLESLYPRLAIRSAVAPEWEIGVKAIVDATDAYSSLNISADSVLSKPSLSGIIIFAHSTLTTSIASHLQKLVPLIVGSLQANCGMDEALTILLYALDPLRAPPRPYLPDEVIHPLFAVIPPLSSSHADPLVRHQAFRILSALLASCPPPVRFMLLKELALDDTFPQMRVAAVGLVKEAVLEGVSHPPHLFASPSFFDVFGPILFKPSPPDLLTEQTLSLDSFQESSESSRLVESLGAYYAILQRDKDNLTHLRNKDALKSVETSLLTPLRLALNRWIREAEAGEGHHHDSLVVASLQMSIERVDGAISNLVSS